MRNLHITVTGKQANLSEGQVMNSFFHAFKDIYGNPVTRAKLESGHPVSRALFSDYYSVRVCPFVKDEFSISLFKGADANPIAYAYIDTMDA